MNDDYTRLRETILRHCTWMATYDRAYAVEAFKRYRENMPWLEL